MKLVSSPGSILRLASRRTLDQVHSSSVLCLNVLPLPARDHGPGKKFPLISAVTVSTDRAAVTTVLHLLLDLIASLGKGNPEGILLSMAVELDVRLGDSLGSDSSQTARERG